MLIVFYKKYCPLSWYFLIFLDLDWCAFIVGPALYHVLSFLVRVFPFFLSMKEQIYLVTFFLLL